ncbi:MAG TPA: ATP-binding cassette domain-containing protein [Bacillota bacterium]|nr:ATP-binding cassette domain-containing protein [Bacillota bacterium]
MAIIEVRDLKKVFQTSVRRSGPFGAIHSLFHPLKNEITAVEGVSFTIEQGENVAYLGPNGAGKSTTIKMLTGILVPSGGDVFVNGLAPYRERQRNSYQIGVVFGQRTQLVLDLPAQDTFELLRYMYSIPYSRYRENLQKYSRLLEVDSFIDRPVRTLSLGQRMRCEILAALLHDPEILFLDEPTIGLDVVAKERIRSFIAEINREKGVTVLLTTHDLGDIERLCSRVIIIDHGRKIYDGSLQLIKENFATERQISLAMPDPASAVQLVRELQPDPALRVATEGLTVKIRYDQRKTDTSELLRRLLAKVNPNDLVMREEDIESVIRRIYQDGIEQIVAQSAG